MNLGEPHEVFCDTSFFFALGSKEDTNHPAAKKWAEEISRKKVTCWTTWDVISETLTLFIRRHSYAMAIEFLDRVEPTLLKVEYGIDLREAAKKTFRKFNRDHSVSFCDCISFHVVKDLLNHSPSLAFDEDFKRLGLLVMDLS